MKRTRKPFLEMLKEFPNVNVISDLEHLVEVSYDIGHLDRFSEAEMDLVNHLIGYVKEFYREYGRDKERKTGGLYIRHPIGVGRILYDSGADFLTVAGGILHDVIEDDREMKEMVDKIKAINRILSAPFEKYYAFFNLAKSYLRKEKDISKEDIKSLIGNTLHVKKIRQELEYSRLTQQHDEFIRLSNQLEIIRQNYGGELKLYFEKEKESIIERIHEKRQSKYAELEKYIQPIIARLGEHNFIPGFSGKLIEIIRGVTRYQEIYDYNESNYLLFNNSEKRADKLRIAFVSISLDSRVRAIMIRLADRLYNMLDIKEIDTAKIAFPYHDIAKSGYRSLTIINYLNTLFSYLGIKITGINKIYIPEDKKDSINVNDIKLILGLKNKLVQASAYGFKIVKDGLESEKIIHSDIIGRNLFVLDNYSGMLKGITIDPISSDFHGNYLLLRKADAGSLEAEHKLRKNVKKLYTLSCEFIEELYEFYRNPRKRFYRAAFYPHAKIY